MTVKIGINGMGRIGRMIVRSIIENKNKNIEIKYINNRTNSETCSSLLKYDSIHGKFNAEIDFDENHIIINKDKILFGQETNLNDINWNKYGVDYVLECTGKFNSKEKLLAHINNGAKRVIVSAPCKDADKTIVYGVNETELKKEDKIISAASCTTNCLAPVATGARQFVVQEAADIILSSFFNSVSFTPYTIVLSASLHGAETITLFAPLLICASNFSLELNLPVHSKT